MQCIDQRPHSNMMRPCLKFKSLFQVAFNMEIENELYPNIVNIDVHWYPNCISTLCDCVLTNAVRMTNDSDCSGRVGQERTRAAANYISLDHCGSSSPSPGTRTQPPARTSADRVQAVRQHSSQTIKICHCHVMCAFLVFGPILDSEKKLHSFSLLRSLSSFLKA